MTTVAIIPARGGSKGIPGKNLMPFCGKPLLAWSIEQALRSRYIKSVYVSSDDDEILKVAEFYGAIGIKRPKEFAGDTSPAEESLLHALDYIEGELGQKIEVVVFLQATSPIRETKDIDNAVEKFLSEGADSLFSAALLEDFCIWGFRNDRLESISSDYKNRGFRQDREPLYLENGSIYVFKPEILRKYDNRLGGKIAMYLMKYRKSFEIDKIEDVEICEYFMKKKLRRVERE